MVGTWPQEEMVTAGVHDDAMQAALDPDADVYGYAASEHNPPAEMTYWYAYGAAPPEAERGMRGTDERPLRGGGNSALTASALRTTYRSSQPNTHARAHAHAHAGRGRTSATAVACGT